MKKIIVFTSNQDHEDRFQNAVGRERWQALHDNQFWNNTCKEPQFVILAGEYDNDSLIFDDEYEDFNLMLIYEPLSKNPEEYEKNCYKDILDNLWRECKKYCQDTNELFVIKHRNSPHYHDLQEQFVKNISPSAQYRSGKYSHAHGDNLFIRTASLLEAANDPDITLEEYRRRLSLLTAGLSFPDLYDKVAEIQIRIFLRCLKDKEKNKDGIVGIKKGTMINLQHNDLQQKYMSFIEEVRVQDPDNKELKACSEETSIQDASQCQATDSNKINWDDFTQHLNQILCSEGLRH